MLVKNKNKIWLLPVIGLIAAAIFVVFNPIQPAGAQLDINENLEEVGAATELGSEDPRIVIARIIRVFLGFLGVVALAIVLYAGFLYLTSGGAEQKVEKAKAWLMNGFIGLVIILASFAITSFIINRLAEATGAVISGTDVSGGGGGGVGPGAMVSGFPVTVSPRGVNKPITSVVRVKYGSGASPAPANDYQNAKDNIKIYALSLNDAEQEVETLVTGTYLASSSDVVFVPDADCPPGCSQTHCLAPNTDYRVKVLNLVSDDGKKAACPSQLQGYCVKTEFSTNELCDLAGPDVLISAPILPVKQDSMADFETLTRDPFGVVSAELCAAVDLNSACETVSPAGQDDPVEFPYIFNVDLFGYETGWHTAKLTGVDVSGNYGEGQRRYLIASAGCFNDDEQFDCGLENCEVECQTECGDMADCDYYCYEGEDQQTICEAWPYPIITGVSPQAGPAGSFVTIRGKKFGESGAKSRVTINNVPAAMACDSKLSWFDTQVVVQVPADTVAGAIKLTNADGEYNDTSDFESPGWKGVFTVLPDQEWVGLCSVLTQDYSTDQANWRPQGSAGDKVSAFGVNFGDSREAEDQVYFGDITADYIGQWDDDKIADIAVPNIKNSRVTVQVGKNGRYSNAVSYLLESTALPMAITQIEPNPAPPGQYITITGSNFGNGGAVNFIDQETQDEYLGIIGCENGWQDAQITVQLPEDIQTGDYTVIVKSGQQQAQAEFKVDEELPVTPGICQIKPDNGLPGTKVGLIGSGFGSEPGSVVFYNNQIIGSAAIKQQSAWTNSALTGIIVPAGAQTGQVQIINQAGQASNKVQFKVQSCANDSCPTGQVCCQNAYCAPQNECQTVPTKAEYSWYFSTGRIPEVPRIIERTCVPQGVNQSPSPSKNSAAACPNGSIGFAFNMLMNPKSFNNQVEIRKCRVQGQECNLDTCDSSVCEKSVYNFTPYDQNTYHEFSTTNYNGHEATEVILRNQALSPNHYYQIVVKNNVFNAPENPDDEPLSMPSDYSWRFKTAGENCAIDSIVVSPPQGVIQEIFETQDYSVNGQGEKCDIMLMAQYGWNWSIEKWSDRIINATPANDLNWPADKARFGVNQQAVPPETPPDEPGIIQAQTLIQQIDYRDQADLAVRFRSPRVIERWPDCDEACVNTLIGGSFNTYMNREAVENPNNLRLYKCQNQDCVNNLTAQELEIDEISCSNTGFDQGQIVSNQAVCNVFDIVFSGQRVLDAGSYYRAAVMSDITSASGINLTALNYNTAAIQTSCGNGIIEPGEDCEAACKDAAGNLCVPDADYKFPSNCTDCSLAYNPYCNNLCAWKGFPICQAGQTENCCGNGSAGACVKDADCPADSTCSAHGRCVEIYPDKIGREECEADCVKLALKTFAGEKIQSPAAACQTFVSDPNNKAVSAACKCEIPAACESAAQYCSYYCLEDPSRECTTQSADCTCMAPQVCQEDSSRRCTADQSACSCVPRRACEQNIEQACTQSSAACTCLEVGVFQYSPALKCFKDNLDEPELGVCVKGNICQEDALLPAAQIRSCTQDVLACTCRPIEEVTGATCAGAGLKLTCPEVCSVNAAESCVFGEQGCACNFPTDCKNCVAENLTASQAAAVYDSYSWVFKTRDNTAPCSIDQVKITPPKYLSVMAGEKIEYRAWPYGAPDVCSAKGQRLNPNQYSWKWFEPQGKAQIISSHTGLVIPPPDNKLISILLTSFSKKKSGSCTELCLNDGSAEYGAVCGNGIIEIGEECDELNNVAAGDGCSEKCLFEGSKACFGANAVNCCGNQQVETNEECDDGNNQAGDGCSPGCLNEGASAAGFVCGNQAGAEYGEDQDFGSAAINKTYGLTAQCLNKGSVYSIEDKLSVCGNQVIEAGEECEAYDCYLPDGKDCEFGEKNCLCVFTDNDYCNENCTYRGFAKCSGEQSSSCCGDGVVDVYDVFNYTVNGEAKSKDIAEECEAVCRRTIDGQTQPCGYGDDGCSCTFPDYCTDQCLNRGSNYIYNSFCNNGKAEPGEDSACEGSGAAPLKPQEVAPQSVVTILGHLSSAEQQETAYVSAMAIKEKKEGRGELTYVYSGLGDAPAPEGCDPKNPPQVIELTPAPEDQLCLNANFVFMFDKLIQSTAGGALTRDNVDFEMLFDGLCSQLAEAGPVKNLYDRMLAKAKSLINNFIGREVFAAPGWCAAPNYQVHQFDLTDSGKSRVAVILTQPDGRPQPFAADSQYRLRLKNLANNCGLKIDDTQYYNFTTGNEYCRFESVEVLPAYFMANKIAQNWDVYHYAKSSNNISISPIDGIYSWFWHPWITTDDQIVRADSNYEPAMAEAQSKSGLAQLITLAEIDQDTIFYQSEGPNNRIVTGFEAVEVFICDNPWFWPPAGVTEDFNSRLSYCRDQGEQNSVQDDLPLLKAVQVPHQPMNCADKIDNDSDGLIDAEQTYQTLGIQPQKINYAAPFKQDWSMKMGQWHIEGSYDEPSNTITFAHGRAADNISGTEYLTPGQYKTFLTATDKYPALEVELKLTYVDGRIYVSETYWRLANWDPDCSSAMDNETPMSDFAQPALADYFFLRDDDVEFRTTNDYSPDAISLRVFANPETLSAREWYQRNAPNPSGSVNDIAAACDFDPIYKQEYCYYGIQDGGTVYISGGNVNDAKELYNNIYVLGFSQGANSNTTKIFSQLVKYLRLNTNMVDAGAEAYQMIKRDVRRMNDISALTGLLKNYYAKNGAYPMLASGTYQTNQAVSSWPSWTEGVFANELGQKLPVDPINQFYQYSAGTDHECVDNDCVCPAECNDGLDNDGDGMIDFEPIASNIPADPNCISGRDISEGADENTESLMQCKTGDQCFEKNRTLTCSICAKGAEISSCYNPNTLTFSATNTEFANSYVYSYVYNLAFDADLSYLLEGEEHGLYQAKNPPSMKLE